MKRQREPLVLHPHQQIGVQRILEGFCSSTFVSHDNVYPTHSLLLHDDMGLGKTIQALEALRRMQTSGRINGPSLIVAPASCLHVWKDEVERWFPEHFTDVRVFINDHATIRTLRNVTNVTLIITSYSTLRSAFQTFLMRHLPLGSVTNNELARLCLGNNLDSRQVYQLLHEDRRGDLLKLARSQLNETIGGVHSKQASKLDGYDTLIRIEYGALILDEIHSIKNTHSKACKAVAFCSARYRLGLSGTPVMNHGREILTLIKYGLGMHQVDWNAIYRNPDSEYCRNLLAAVCFGRKKVDIPELAGLIPTRDAKDVEEVVLPWTDNAAARKLYIEVRETSLKMLGELRNLRPIQREEQSEYNARRSHLTQCFWGQFQALRQISLHHFLVQRENVDLPRINYSSDTAFIFPAWMQRKCHVTNLCLLRKGLPQCVRAHVCTWLAKAERYELQPSPKMIAFMQILKNAHGTGKVVAVSQFRSFLEQILQPYLTDHNIGSVLFGGGSRSKQKKALAAFHSNPDIRVMLMVKSSGAHGLNLQGDSATVVIFESHFNGSLDEQASQRVDRLGQVERHVVIRKLFMKGSVDEALKLMQEKKTAQAEAWMERGEKELTLETVGLFLAEMDTV